MGVIVPEIRSGSGMRFFCSAVELPAGAGPDLNRQPKSAACAPGTIPNVVPPEIRTPAGYF
jgi:hypothetical protein